MTRDRGSVSVLLAASILVVLVLVLGVADLGRVLVARSRARSAADAAALAAAQEMALPTGEEPAVFAAAFATANGASLVTCVCEVGTFEAVVEVTVPVGDLRLVPGSPIATARARAVVDLPTPPGNASLQWMGAPSTADSHASTATSQSRQMSIPSSPSSESPP
ncbi:MAG: Rv3654c family TadE-like protein [Actinomycetota bacterium]